MPFTTIEQYESEYFKILRQIASDVLIPEGKSSHEHRKALEAIQESIGNVLGEAYTFQEGNPKAAHVYKMYETLYYASQLIDNAYAPNSTTPINWDDIITLEILDINLVAGAIDDKDEENIRNAGIRTMLYALFFMRVLAGEDAAKCISLGKGVFTTKSSKTSSKDAPDTQETFVGFVLYLFINRVTTQTILDSHILDHHVGLAAVAYQNETEMAYKGLRLCATSSILEFLEIIHDTPCPYQKLDMFHLDASTADATTLHDAPLPALPNIAWSAPDKLKKLSLWKTFTPEVILGHIHADSRQAVLARGMQFFPMETLTGFQARIFEYSIDKIILLMRDLVAHICPNGSSLNPDLLENYPFLLLLCIQNPLVFKDIFPKIQADTLFGYMSEKLVETMSHIPACFLSLILCEHQLSKEFPAQEKFINPTISSLLNTNPMPELMVSHINRYSGDLKVLCALNTLACLS